MLGAHLVEGRPVQAGQPAERLQQTLADLNGILTGHADAQQDGKQLGAAERLRTELPQLLAVLRAEYNRAVELGDEVGRLARRFKVSTLVILRRIHDAGGLTREELWEAYEQELALLSAIPKGSGGDFYLTQAARVSKRFARALVVSTLEGQTLHRDAFRMLGFSKLQTFHELGRSLGVMGL
jgi:hypothetical protein